MPRLTNELDLERHRFLAKAWQDIHQIYSVIPAPQQWDVHRYYQTQVDAADLRLLTNREALTREDLSLPHRAGKAFADLFGVFRFAYEQAQGDERRFHQIIKAHVLPTLKLLLSRKDLLALDAPRRAKLLMLHGPPAEATTDRS